MTIDNLHELVESSEMGFNGVSKVLGLSERHLRQILQGWYPVSRDKERQIIGLTKPNH